MTVVSRSRAAPWWRHRACDRLDRGSGTVLMLCVIVLVAAAAAAATALGQAVLARHRAAAAADLAALAAAAAQPWPDCRRGIAVALANGAEPISCAVGSDASVVVEVQVLVQGGFAGLVARGRARAGPGR